MQLTKPLTIITLLTPTILADGYEVGIWRFSDSNCTTQYGEWIEVNRGECWSPKEQGVEPFASRFYKYLWDSDRDLGSRFEGKCEVCYYEAEHCDETRGQAGRLPFQTDHQRRCIAGMPWRVGSVKAVCPGLGDPGC